MAGGVVLQGTADISRVEAPVTVKAYLICAFAAFGGIFFGYDTGKPCCRPRLPPLAGRGAFQPLTLRRLDGWRPRHALLYPALYRL